MIAMGRAAISPQDGNGGSRGATMPGEFAAKDVFILDP